MISYYNAKVKKRPFIINDLALWRIFLFCKELRVGLLGPNWEGLDRIKEKLRPISYWIEGMDGKVQLRA